MLGQLRNAITSLATSEQREHELARANLKNMGYYLARIVRATTPAPLSPNPNGAPLTSKACVQRDVESPWFHYWCSQLVCSPIYHRKVWELCYIPQVLFNEGKLKPGSVGLGFGCGEEPLPSLFAKFGVKVVATDLDPNRSESKAWIETDQHSASIEKMRNSRICPDPALLQNISLRYVDMNAIPADLANTFDFCWSTCSLEHLGSIALGLRFIEESLKTLKPGGVAVHTTEWNMADEGPTLDHCGCVLFQKRHFTEFADRMRKQGYHVSELDFSMGEEIFDGLTDLPPYGPHTDDVAHLRLAIQGFRCTSFGMIIRKPE